MSFVMPESAANSLQKSLGMFGGESELWSAWCVGGCTRVSTVSNCMCFIWNFQSAERLADVIGKQPHSVFVGIHVTCLQSF